MSKTLQVFTSAHHIGWRQNSTDWHTHTSLKCLCSFSFSLSYLPLLFILHPLLTFSVNGICGLLPALFSHHWSSPLLLPHAVLAPSDSSNYTRPASGCHSTPAKWRIGGINFFFLTTNVDQVNFEMAKIWTDLGNSHKTDNSSPESIQRKMHV